MRGGITLWMERDDWSGNPIGIMPCSQPLLLSSFSQVFPFVGIVGAIIVGVGVVIPILPVVPVMFITPVVVVTIMSPVVGGILVVSPPIIDCMRSYRHLWIASSGSVWFLRWSPVRHAILNPSIVNRVHSGYRGMISFGFSWPLFLSMVFPVTSASFPPGGLACILPGLSCVVSFHILSD